MEGAPAKTIWKSSNRLSHLNHSRQIILDFLQPATRQQSQDWSMNIKLILCTELLKWLLISGTEFIHLLRRQDYLHNVSDSDAFSHRKAPRKAG